MKKIIVISDTHGCIKAIEKLKPLLAENDYLIHLGDGSRDLFDLWNEFPDKIHQCRGNCDLHAFAPFDGELEVEQSRIFYCHGDAYGVKAGRAFIAAEAKKRGCNIALYGHTHTARIEEIDGVLVINPGALNRPHNEGGSYCYLVINKDKATPIIVGESVF